MSPLTVTARALVVQAPPASALQHGSSGAVWLEHRTVGPETGFDALEQTLIECGPGSSGASATEDAEEVLFVLEGTGTLTVSGIAYALEPESGASMAPHQSYELRNESSLTLRIVAVRIPNPDLPVPGSDAPAGSGATAGAGRAVVRRLADQHPQAATAAREYRIVADPRHGLRSATHFVGYIPTARAPDHFHTYDEVIYVLEGNGVFHAHGNEWPLSAGSCIQLPARTIHCLENTGGQVMRVAAVFRPAGSPAAAYYPDGTPAHPDAPPLGASPTTATQ